MVISRRYSLRSTMRPFSFLKLPPEIRHAILVFALTQEGEISPKIIEMTRKKHYNDKCRKFSNMDIGKLKENSFTRIFLVDRQFYSEARPIAYGRNTFHFNELQDFCYFIQHAGPNNPKLVTKVAIGRPLIAKHPILGTHILRTLNNADVWLLLYPRNSKICANWTSSTATFGQEILAQMPALSHVEIRVAAGLKSAESPGTYYAPRLSLTGYTDPDDALVPYKVVVRNPHYMGNSRFEGYHETALDLEIKRSILGRLIAEAYLFHLLDLLGKIRERKKGELVEGESETGSSF